jgi:DNA polymerase-3 subunit gamma/tau
MLTKEAFNALLKTLEEPPPGVYFVFATTEAHKVPATIRSRCQRYDFHRIAAPTLVATLARLAEKEKIAADPAALAEIARQADGGLRDAESLLDQAAAVGEGRVTLETIRELLGEAEEGIVLRIAERLAEQNAVAAFTELQGLLEQGLDPQRIALSLTQTFRDLLVARASTGDLEGLGLRPDLVGETRRVAACFTPGKLTALLALAGRTVAELRRSPRPRLALEVALASMARLEDPGAMDELIGRLDAMEQGGEAREPRDSARRVPQAEARVPKTEPPVSRVVEETREAPERQAAEVEETRAEPRAVEGPHGALWGSLLGAVRSRKMMLASFLDHGRPISVEEDVLLVAFDNSYHEGIVNRRENLEMIHEELHRVAGKAIAFRVKREAPQARSGSERTSAAPVSTRDILGQNPGLGRLLDELGGRLLPGGLGGGS